MIELRGGRMEVAYVEARQVGLGPFADARRYDDTDNALRPVYGYDEAQSYSSSLESSPISEDDVIWGNAEDPWNQPGWVQPPARPSQPARRDGQQGDEPKPRLRSRDLEEDEDHSHYGDANGGPGGGNIQDHINEGYEQIRSKSEYLQYLDSGSSIRTLFSGDDSFGGKFIRITQIDGADSFKIVNQFVIDVEAHPEVAALARKDRDSQLKRGEEGTLEELQDAAGDLEFTDFTEVINRRYRDGEDMPASMEQAADDWLRTYKGSREEFEKTYENILDNEDAWSNEELEALLRSGALENKALLERAVSAILYEREGVAQAQDYENALNGLAVWIRDQDANDGSFPDFDGKAKRYLKTIVHHEMRLFEREKGMNTAYHEGDEHLLDKLPSLIARRVENAFADDGSTKNVRFAARDKVTELLKDATSAQHKSMASIILTEYGNFSDWARVFHSDELDTGNDNRYRDAPGS